jgi:hypothetical protein
MGSFGFGEPNTVFMINQIGVSGQLENHEVVDLRVLLAPNPNPVC